MKFYDCSTAPSPRRVRIFLAEKGVELPVVPVDLASGEQFSEAFRQINPDCTVPVLELDDGRCISEVIAICDYLEQRYPEPPLLGRDPEERATVMMWNARLEAQLLLPLADLFRNTSKALADHAVPGPVRCEQIPALAGRGRERALAFFDRLDAELAGREFVAGDGYSMADITALMGADFAKWSKLDAAASRPNLARWHQAVSARPSSAA